MADAKALRFDDFVGAARPDPDRPQPLIMLTGYVGRSDAEGRLRIYADASLNSWLDAAEDDVVHSAPIADSPLGGSHVWLRGTAAITPGAAVPASPEPVQGEEARPEARAAAAIPTIPECTQLCWPTMAPQCLPTLAAACLAAGAALGNFPRPLDYNTQSGCPTYIPWTTILCQ